MNIQYRQIKRPYSFLSPFKGAEFAALVYIEDTDITIEEQNALSDQLVTSGCRYAVCAGHNCSSWDDSIDMADIKRNDGAVNDDNLVMTTWHENEPLKDIVFHYLNNTSFGNFAANWLLVLVVGDNESTLENIRNEIKKQLSLD